MKIKNKIAFWTGKLSFFLARFLNFKSTSGPGLISNKISDDLIDDFFSKINKSIFVTGTNGKSTSTGFLANILEKEFDLICNKSGANLKSGLLTSFIKASNFKGEVYSKNILFEIDEAVLHYICKIKPPDYILINNFFRDQLDRFGEMSNTINLVQKGLDYLSEKNFIICNSDDPNVCSLKAKNIIYFGLSPELEEIDNLKIFAEELGLCPKCKNELKYNKQWLGQFGDYYCTYCDYIKPKLNVEIKDLKLNINSSEISVDFKNLNDNRHLDLTVPIGGLFNVYNALGVICTANALKISHENIKSGIETYRPLFGRSQKIKYNNKNCQIFLIKNPIGASEVLRLLSKNNNSHILIIINDNYADGRDVSWLWDAYFEYLNNNKNIIYLSGSRASDIAVRLKYAGININNIKIINNIKACIKEFTEINSKEDFYILPTYTALLELTKILNIKY